MTDIASHRGGAALWPENSERAFRETLKLGVEQIEFDVQLSADGVPVIFHDLTLDRVTDGTGPLTDRTLAELQRLTIFRDGGRIMTLAEGAAILRDSPIVLRCEVKPGPEMVPYPGLTDMVLDLLSGMELLPRTVITSFHLGTVADVVARRQQLSDVIWLVSDQILRLTSPAHVARMAAETGVEALSVNIAMLDDPTVAALRRERLRLGAFAVLEDDAIRRAFDLGLTVFTTDRPDAALRLRAAAAHV